MTEAGKDDDMAKTNQNQFPEANKLLFVRFRAGLAAPYSGEKRQPTILSRWQALLKWDKHDS